VFLKLLITIIAGKLPVIVIVTWDLASLQGVEISRASQKTAKYRECCAYWRRLVCDSEIAVEQSIVESNNLGKFFRHVNARLSCRVGIGCIIFGDRPTVVLEDYAKANVFNRYFASIGDRDGGTVSTFPSLVDDDKV